jgi:RND family efflux transporter MFP subunit
MLTSHAHFTCVLGLAVALLNSGCARTQAEAPAEPSSVVPSVAVAKATRESLSREVVLTGEFKPYQSADLHAKVAGYLKQISVDVGDRVTAGQLLATIEIPEINDELVRSEAESRRSTSELERAKGDLDRALAHQTLVDVSYKRLEAVTKTQPGLVAHQEIDEALARKRSADAQVAGARAALVSAQQQIDISKATEQRSKTMVEYSRILAPFSGMITKRFADPGTMIQAGTASQSQAIPVVRLAQIDRLRTIIPVPESMVPLVRVGAPVTIRVNSLGKSFRGSISRYTGDVLTSTRTMEAESDIVNPGQLMPGMYADVVLTLEKRDNAITVPVQALMAHGGKQSVLVVNAQSLIEERTIEVGIQTSAKVEARSGLEEGEMVVIGNRTELKPGQKVGPKVAGVS